MKPLTAEELDRLDALAKQSSSDCFDHADNACAYWCWKCKEGVAAARRRAELKRALPALIGMARRALELERQLAVTTEEAKFIQDQFAKYRLQVARL